MFVEIQLREKNMIVEENCFYKVWVWVFGQQSMLKVIEIVSAHCDSIYQEKNIGCDTLFYWCHDTQKDVKRIASTAAIFSTL